MLSGRVRHYDAVFAAVLQVDPSAVQNHVGPTVATDRFGARFCATRGGLHLLQGTTRGDFGEKEILTQKM